MRPRSLDDVVGQPQLLGAGRPLRRLIDGGRLHSMVLWGPPGTGKTTLARLLARRVNADFTALSAVNSGVRDIRAAVETAQAARSAGRATVVFVDEVHRFNKAQQDGFLPYIEDGTVVFVGATTENPSFELNNALLSRLQVYVLQALDTEALTAVVQRAMVADGALQALAVTLTPQALESIVQSAAGDARQALNYLELAFALAMEQGTDSVTAEGVDSAVGQRLARFDKRGEVFYELISALHKSVRGSNPDAALYWLARMLEGGCDPHYVLRRLTRIAAEDVGTADPRALGFTLDAWQGYDRLGSPEGDLLIAQAAVYLACASKSNAVYRAYDAARADVKRAAAEPVPMHLRNAPTGLQRKLGYGKHYRYDHDEAGGHSRGQRYFPAKLGEPRYYHPVDRGLEQRIAERLRQWREPAPESGTKGE